MAVIESKAAERKEGKYILERNAKVRTPLSREEGWWCVVTWIYSELELSSIISREKR